ncbi:hypothetical protein [Bacillus sp. S/N-304-OC-R1]|uniref:hypothetical protein n=1 Tax=Bacillus sp. S/N-304-OC-R1 TaxID=2758034 RepID=UPI001C8EB672|nr:hypothetical protein [Bacillus sp. S/N-304-OC-R1]MBY0120374.1 hypothetical protein [Bacillus sp. S/N-304-OC-R1]
MYDQVYVIEKLEKYRQEELNRRPYYTYHVREKGVKKQLCSIPIINYLPPCQCNALKG